MNELLIYFLVFSAALLGVQASYWLVVEDRRAQRAVNRRLMLSKQNANSQDVLDQLRRERGLLLGESNFGEWNDWVMQTGLRFDRFALIASAFALSAGYFVILGFAIGFGLAALGMGLILGCLSLFLFFAVVRRKRMARFSAQLPEAIDVIVRGVRAGYPFTVAIGLVAKEMPDPIGTEFGMVSDEINFGAGVQAALDNLFRRVGQEDLPFLIMSLKIQTQTGGNLAEILARLGRLLRSRSKLRLKVKALTAEGRTSGLFLSLAPFVLFAIITLLSPHYFTDVRNHPFIPPAVILSVFLLMAGNIWIYRMVHFKV